MLGPHIPGRELLEEVATRRLWSVCKGLGAALLETTEEAGLANTPSDALDLDTQIGAPLSKGYTGRGQSTAHKGFSTEHKARTFAFFIHLLIGH